MDKSILICRFCCTEFDSESHAPHMIPSCGHSICRLCLSAQTSFQTDWECPEEGCNVKGDIPLIQFPANHSLLKLLNSTIKGPLETVSLQNSRRRSTSGSPTISLIHRNETFPVLANPFESEENTKPVQFARTEGLGSENPLRGLRDRSKTDDSSLYNRCDSKTPCAFHGNPMTIVCTEPCQRLICYECGLFGEHKVYLEEPYHDA